MDNYDFDIFEPKIGEVVPEDLAFEVFHEGKISPKTFADFRGSWTVLLFYPADFTFVCPTELEDMQSLYTDFKKEGAEVLSMSTDTAFAHKVWKEVSPTMKMLEYPMGADSSHAVAEAFEVLIPENGLAQRGTFVISPEGVIKTIEITDGSIGRSAKDTLRKLKAAKFTASHPGDVCPANFDDGSDSLAPSVDLVGKI